MGEIADYHVDQYASGNWGIPAKRNNSNKPSPGGNKMELRKASRKKAKIRAGLFGPAGSGKTYSALLMAHGLCNDWGKIAIIDTENQSADLYDHLGPYNVLSLEPPFRPERYITAIMECEKAGMEVIIIDSISHEWEGSGGLLEESNNMKGNSFTNWDALGKRHKKMNDKILTSPAHIIACGRTKVEYVLEESLNRDGKTVQIPRKVGTKVITREGFDYEVTLAFELSIDHYARCGKDRTDLFMRREPFVITEETGKEILEWCNSGKELSPEEKEEAEIQRLQDEIRTLMIEKQLDKHQMAELTGVATLTGQPLNVHRDVLEKLSA